MCGMELRSMNPLNGLFAAQSRVGSLRGFYMAKEIWKDMIGFEDLYKVSSNGRVWDKRNDTLKKLMKNNRGYYSLEFVINGVATKKRICRLVLEHFVGPANGKQVNHKNSKKGDDRLSNLEWVTSRQNTLHALLNRKMPAGVTKRPDGRFVAQIGYKKTNYYLGTYEDKNQAAAAYFGVLKFLGLEIGYADRKKGKKNGK